MSQLQHAPRRVTALTASIVGLVAAAVISISIVLGMLIPTGVRVLTADVEAPGQVNPALVDAGRQWQTEREQQGGFSDPRTEAGQAWENQRRQQSPFDGE